jgi:hypothetical protein
MRFELVRHPFLLRQWRRHRFREAPDDSGESGIPVSFQQACFRISPPCTDPEAHHGDVAARMQSRWTGEGHLPQHAARLGKLADRKHSGNRVLPTLS